MPKPCDFIIKNRGLKGDRGVANDFGEIEGDSVLFYLLGEPPALEAIVDQSKRTFIDFHSAIQTMILEFDCNCSACTTVSNLTLKFITHWGECKEVPIQKFTKLIGSDVILAHRLLKNSVPGSGLSFNGKTLIFSLCLCQGKRFIRHFNEFILGNFLIGQQGSHSKAHSK